MEQLLKSEFERRLKGESLARITQCLGLLTEAQVWHTPHQGCNSIGNLILHLCGNIRQWIVSGLSASEDIRDRPKEFVPEQNISKKELLARISNIIDEAVEVVKESERAILERPKVIQGLHENGVSIIVHVIEHTSYHVGQISYITKWLNEVDLNYYPGIE